ncbi:6-phosphogluconolactonase [Chondrinema litorale]|uniref:6-phosphogluconolactonase n=1 Tax=Chondrinema litorale TaxID=2994555 RepID=UPI002543D364|nr:6-phosphogluconolactonase [Chondrinema litorale]UZR95841.1 6-phosphogluconolactonase [Chondrinema litorale]
MENHIIKIFNDATEASEFAASLIATSSKEAINQHDRFDFVLTGGSSPVKLYKLLTEEPSKSKIDWKKTHVYHGDERFVPYESDLSNTRMADEILLNHLDIPSQNVHKIDTSLENVEAAAADYEKVIKEETGNNVLPVLDLILLGVGDDGHTASLFPGTQVVHEKDKLVSTSYNAEQETERVTLTAPIINEAKLIAPMVFGKKKAETIKEILEGEFNPDVYPAQLLRQAKGTVYWILDKESASLLS